VVAAGVVAVAVVAAGVVAAPPLAAAAAARAFALAAAKVLALCLPLTSVFLVLAASSAALVLAAASISEEEGATAAFPSVRVSLDKLAGLFKHSIPATIVCATFNIFSSILLRTVYNFYTRFL